MRQPTKQHQQNKGDDRRFQEHTPIHIEGTVVEKVESFKFLDVHITDKMKWSIHTDSVVKKMQQYLFNLSRLKKCVLSPKTLTNFYAQLRASCRVVCYGNCTILNRKALQRVVRSAQTLDHQLHCVLNVKYFFAMGSNNCKFNLGNG
jgi:hypothetical protein